MKKSKYDSLSEKIAGLYWFKEDVTNDELFLLDSALSDLEDRTLAEYFIRHLDNSPSHTRTVEEQSVYNCAKEISNKK